MPLSVSPCASPPEAELVMSVTATPVPESA